MYHGSLVVKIVPPVAFYLIVLAVGFWVYKTASESSGPVHKIGRVTGGLIMVVALVGGIWSALCRFYPKPPAAMGPGSDKACCLMMSTPAPSPAPAQGHGAKK